MVDWPHAEKNGDVMTLNTTRAKSQGRRCFFDGLVRFLSTLAAGIGVFFLIWIFIVILQKGMAALNWDFFTEMPRPPGDDGGGLANAIFGTFMMTSLATLMGVPIGIFSGIYLAEFGKKSRLANLIRFSTNILMGMPSIIVGIFVYGILVYHTKTFSGYAGAVALSLIMIPTVCRTTEDMIALVPNTLRESALALGAPRWKVINGVVFRAAKSGLLTGVLLSIARVGGETAPLLFTALNSPHWPTSLAEPTANLSVTIFNYALSPFAQWQNMAWAASFLITLSVLGLTLVSRFLLRERLR